ncbi:hypothetical protein OG607_33225 [Streptomyces sp. NBC_01537]|uniref:hypothetical protein n=1 Tax=Streptomyces sp. NBC_01537 TaxID=2903896 RepID=UPI00386CFA0F
MGEELRPHDCSLAQALRDLFEILGETLQAYALRTHSDRGTVSRYLSGKRIPPRTWVVELHGNAAQAARDGIDVMAAEQLLLLHSRARAASKSPVQQNQGLQEALEAAYRDRDEARRAMLQPPQHPEMPEQQQPTPERSVARWERVSREIDRGLHVERLPALLSELQQLGRGDAVIELLGVAGRRPVPQVIRALDGLEAAGLGPEADMLVGLAALRTPAEVVALAVADRSVEDVSELVVGLSDTELKVRGVNGLFSGIGASARCCTDEARLFRILHDRGCETASALLVGKLAECRDVDHVVGLVIALHEVRLPEVSKELIFRCRASARWLRGLAKALERVALHDEAGHARQLASRG